LQVSPLYVKLGANNKITQCSYSKTTLSPNVIYTLALYTQHVSSWR